MLRIAKGQICVRALVRVRVHVCVTLTVILKFLNFLDYISFARVFHTLIRKSNAI